MAAIISYRCQDIGNVEAEDKYIHSFRIRRREKEREEEQLDIMAHKKTEF